MSLKLEMLQVARLAPKLLGDSTQLVVDFVRSRLAGDGGFMGREDRSDLYYTVFGVECLIALQAEVPWERIAPFVRGFEDGGDLDLVHLACLVRLHSAMPRSSPERERIESWVSRLGAFRSEDGGYHNEAGSAGGTVYGCFMATGMCQDLGFELPDVDRVERFLRRMETPDAAYANDSAMSVGTTPATAAAVTLLRALGRPQRPGVGAWLEARCHPEGGFHALPGAPMPDLLSTATALHALAGLAWPLEALREPCLDFVDSLWTNRGGFYGHWADNVVDCEYTFYGLLALGHLHAI